MHLSRRSLLKLAIAGAAHPLLPVRGIVSQAFAAPGAGSAKFLLVFLRGGYDAANVVIPVGSPFYYESRPTIAIPKPDVANPLAAIALPQRDGSTNWALHPALKDAMLPFWEKGQLAFVPFAGTDDLTRSHFETQDSVETEYRWRPRRHAAQLRSGSSIVWPRAGAAPVLYRRLPT